MDLRIFIGTEPLSIAALQNGKIFVLTDTQVEVYDRLGVQIAIHDNNNLSCFGGQWGGYLLAGTNDGDMVLINPTDWNQVVVYHSPL